jgi:hypothetical protein
MTLPLLHYRSFVAPKDGHTADECEDAWACNNPARRFAVADGASESIYAGEWARHLCDAYVADSTADGIGPWLGIAQKRWRALVHGLPAPWHVAEKLDDGAFATFLGLRVEPGGHWHAVAAGDTCLFLSRGDELKLAFPVRAAAEFGTRPELISSRHRGRVRAVTAHGDLMDGDRLWLMTDALAAWFLAEREAGSAPWRELDGRTADDFAAWVAGRRADGRLKNDDVTLVVIDVGGADGRLEGGG